MSDKIKVISTNLENISEYPPRCFLNPKNEGYLIKLDWLKKRFSEGLIIKQIYSEEEKKCIGFIEYIPGEHAWRAVDAKGYMFIHCLWISQNKYKEKGYGTLLVEECLQDAKKDGKLGVAVVASEGAFMSGKGLFLKNGFHSIAAAKPSFDLMVKILKKGPLPEFRDWEKQLEKHTGLNIVYSNQCPWVARSIKEINEIAEKEGIKLKIVELKTAAQAQNAPSIYSVFNLVFDGTLLADHYISKTRFKNIIKKKIKNSQPS